MTRLYGLKQRWKWGGDTVVAVVTGVLSNTAPGSDTEVAVGLTVVA